MDQRYDLIETPLGWVGMVGSERGIARTTLPQAEPPGCLALLGLDADDGVRDRLHFAALAERIGAYFAGEDVSFEDQELDLPDVGAFSRAAWQACRTIPYGETRTYGWLAAQAGRPDAPRAAGQTMARNRLPIVIPCHRVIGADGALRGFGRGTTLIGLKRRLLEMEGPALFSRD